MKQWDKAAFFAGGILFATAGVAALTSECAKKIYTNCTALVLRGKDYVMDTQAAIRENCLDIYEDALDINEEKAQEAAERELEEARELLKVYEEMQAEAEVKEE